MDEDVTPEASESPATEPPRIEVPEPVEEVRPELQPSHPTNPVGTIQPDIRPFTYSASKDHVLGLTPEGPTMVHITRLTIYNEMGAFRITTLDPEVWRNLERMAHALAEEQEKLNAKPKIMLPGGPPAGAIIDPEELRKLDELWKRS